MRLLRGRDEPAGPAAAEDSAPGQGGDRGQTPGKGRPTPSRREAQGARRGPVPPPPRNQREALRRMRRTGKQRRGNRGARRQRQATRRERMMAGDERYLPARDRGPDRAHARDVVDARRSIMTLFMPLALVLLVIVFVPAPQIKEFASLATTAMLLIMVVEGFLLGRMVNRRVRARFPDTTASRFGLGYYAFTRATQPRRLRVPKPRVGPGATV